MKFATAVSAAIAFAAAAVLGAAIDTVDAGNVTVTPLAAPFGINIGVNAAFDNVVAWVSGQSKCSAVILGPNGANFCGRNFVLTNPATGNGITFVAGGCGASPFWITQVSKGGVFAYCTPFSEADQCGVTTLWHCI